MGRQRAVTAPVAATSRSTGSGAPPRVPRVELGAAALALLCLANLASACFITNCPIGGKRALSHAQAASAHPAAAAGAASQLRQCMSCGPEGLGQCYGPDICCGESIGCFIRTTESAACAGEDDVPVPCAVRGRPCGDNRNGRCATDGVCCNDKYCQIDSECKETKGERQKALNQAFMAVLKDMMSQRGAARGGALQQPVA